MKIYPNEFWLEEFEIHSQDEVNYYHYEVVGRELFTWTFAKKYAYIVGTSNLHCTKCGMKYGSNGCKHCKPFVQTGTWFDGSKKGHGLTIPADKIQENDLYIVKRINNNPPNKWKEWIKDKHDDQRMLIHYVCHNCKYFMYHHLNYCYKCGQRFERLSGTYGDLRRVCEGYRDGF